MIEQPIPPSNTLPISSNSPSSSTTSAYHAASQTQVPKLLLIAVVVLLGLASLLFITKQFIGFDSTKTRSVTTSGKATKTVPAGQATIVFQYSQIGDDQNFVKADGDKQVAGMITSLEGLGNIQVEVSAAQLGPIAKNALTQQQPPSYEYRKTAKVTLKDVSVLAATYEILSNPRVTIVQTNFSPADENTVQAELMGLAVANAKDKATTIAKSSSQRIGRVINVTEVVTNREQSNVLFSLTPGATDQNTPQNVEVVVNINAAFELK